MGLMIYSKTHLIIYPYKDMKLLGGVFWVFCYSFPGFPERLPFGQTKPWATDRKPLRRFRIIFVV